MVAVGRVAARVVGLAMSIKNMLRTILLDSGAHESTSEVSCFCDSTVCHAMSFGLQHLMRQASNQDQRVDGRQTTSPSRSGAAREGQAFGRSYSFCTTSPRHSDVRSTTQSLSHARTAI
jgi:hypothetical protein